MKTFIVILIVGGFIALCAFFYYRLCKSYKEMMKGSKNAKSAENSEQAQETEQKDPKEVFCENLMELRARGWSYSQIAKQMGMSKTSVIRHFQRARRK